jgi:phage gp46-like protein
MSHFQLAALTEPIKSAEGLKHAVLQSLLNWAKAQKNDPLDEGQDKQGWWGGEFVQGVGCRDWTLARSKQTADTLNRAKRHTEQALQWLIDKKVVKSIEVTTYFEEGHLLRLMVVTLMDNTILKVTV